MLTFDITGDGNEPPPLAEVRILDGQDFLGIAMSRPQKIPQRHVSLLGLLSPGQELKYFFPGDGSPAGSNFRPPLTMLEILHSDPRRARHAERDTGPGLHITRSLARGKPY